MRKCSVENMDVVTEPGLYYVGFKAQENAIREYVKLRGHECIFLPKFHPGICCLSVLSPPLSPHSLLIFQSFGRALLGC